MASRINVKTPKIRGKRQKISSETFFLIPIYPSWHNNLPTSLEIITRNYRQLWLLLQAVNYFESRYMLATSITSITSSQMFWQLLQAINSFGSCYKLCTALTAVTSCWQFWKLKHAVDSFDSWYKLTTILKHADEVQYTVTQRDGSCYQNGWMFGKLPKGKSGGAIFNQKNYISDFGPLYSFFRTFSEKNAI